MSISLISVSQVFILYALRLGSDWCFGHGTTMCVDYVMRVIHKSCRSSFSGALRSRNGNLSEVSTSFRTGP